MRQQILAGITLSLTVGCAAMTMPVQAAILDFDATITGSDLTLPYEEDGFRIVVQTGHYDIWGPSLPDCGNGLVGDCTSNYLNVDGYGFGDARVRLTMSGGGDFDLFSLNVLSALVLSDAGEPECGTNCTVTSSSGGSISFLSQGVMNFSGAGWTNLSWVEFFTAGEPQIFLGFASASIDDINVAPVAVPAVGWLLAPAFGLLGYRKRRALSN